MTLLFVLKVLHIAAASVWMGGGLTASQDIRRTLLLGQPHVSELMPRLRAVARLMNTSALVTVLSGAAIILAIGGFGRVPHRIHLGLVLTLLVVGAGRYLIRPAITQIAQAMKAPITPQQIDQIMVRFRLGIGIEHALRVAVLVLMVYPFTF